MNLTRAIPSFASCRAVVLFAFFLSIAPLLSQVVAQTTSANDGDWQVPRTPFGHPDLQGNWTNATLTPFERPLGWDPVLTWDKVAEIECLVQTHPWSKKQFQESLDLIFVQLFLLLFLIISSPWKVMYLYGL